MPTLELQVHVSADELDAITDHALTKGLTLNQLARRAMISEATA